MIDYDVLAAFGTTNARLREIFTAKPEDFSPKRGETKEEKKERIALQRKNERDIKLRERWRQRIESRVHEGICQSLKDWRLYAAVDLAWDSTVITKTTLPLLLYAQGKIDVARAETMLKGVKDGEKYVKKNESGESYIDLPMFVEANFNLIRSIINRRRAAQRVKYGQLWPFYKYEARSTGLVAKCRADVLSQRVDMMVDQFGMRHHDNQCIRDGFLYSHCFDFVRSSWEVEKQLQRKEFGGDPSDTRAVITKEGICFVNPHPSRVAWDRAYPPSSINEDNGCEWALFWDVCRFGDIDDNPYYFNKDAVGWTNKLFMDAGVSHADYFSHYQYTITPPVLGSINPAAMNDARNAVGTYASTQRDSSVFKTEYFERIIPKNVGAGEYPYPVWVRLVVASDSTVIFGELLPSTPGAYLGMNENDNRQVNVSMAMELFSAQDQMNNLMTHLLLVCQVELLKIIGINTDMVDAEKLKAIRKRLSGRSFYCEPQIIEYSLLKLQDMGVKVDKVIDIAETRQGTTITAIFEAMVRLIELTEKLQALSPAEQGQPAPREISATEVNAIENTTSSIYSDISEDIDEFRSAKKRIIYESLVACSKGEVVCPVKDRYTPKTIESAGFQLAKNEDEDYRVNVPGASRRVTVIGSPRMLVHDYIFTSRDGAERPVNTQAANTLVQLISQVLAVPMVAQALGKEKIYELFNEVFRLSGAGIDLNLALREGEEDSLGPDQIAEMQGQLEQLAQYLQKMAGQIQKNSEDLLEQEQVNQQQEQTINGVRELALRVKKMAEDVDELHGKHQEIQKRLVENINYKDAPPSIQAQIERQAGFVPAPLSERVKQEPAKKPSTPK